MESWNVGVVNKARCEAAVVAGNNGDFLLRSLKNGKMILCVNDNGSAVNFTIKRNDVRGSLTLSAADCAPCHAPAPWRHAKCNGSRVPCGVRRALSHACV